MTTIRPYEQQLNNHINQNEYELDDESRLNLSDDFKFASTTERWRQNDKFILVENPLALAINNNRTMPTVIFQQQHHSDSSDEFQFPKVT